MATLRALPSVHQLLEAPQASAMVASHGRPLVRFAVQHVIEEERRTGAIAEPEARWSAIERVIQELRRPRLRPVVNATGVILHTNLGRAPLAAAAADAAARVAARYSTLEFDPQTGRRARRHDLVADTLRHLTGAEAAAVVNNCAAAVLLMLTALARGKEVIVARGELVEIGGGFRMPDVMRLSGARMVEVGTTNRTRIEDYEGAITPRTAAILKVHASNFQVVGFTESVELKPLAALAHQRQLLLLHDLGSGSLIETTAYGLAAEPRIQDSLQSGVDLVAASGDKMLGGPQAGLLLGRAELVERVMKHPFARAVRVDQLTTAARTATRGRARGRCDRAGALVTHLVGGSFVVGTAGHIDHGKSALVKALTDIDPDRLEEEKRRGMPIALGFAYLQLPSGRRVGIVDVPGHQRFLKNMLAGVHGMDAVLLVVAADEGPMPQTREHLAIIDLLEIDHGLVVLTKIDLVSDDWLALVREELAGLLRGTSLSRAPIIAVSSTTGAGLDQLRAALA